MRGQTHPLTPRSLSTLSKGGSPQRVLISGIRRAWEMLARRHQVLGGADAPGPAARSGWGLGKWSPQRRPRLLGGETLTAASGLRFSRTTDLSARWQSRRQPAFPRGREPVLPPRPLPEPHRAARRAHLPAHVVPPFRMPPRRLGFARAVPGVAGGTGHHPTHIPLRPFSTNEKAKPEVGLHAEGHDFDSKSSAAFLCHRLQMTTTNLLGESELCDKKSILFSLIR